MLALDSTVGWLHLFGDPTRVRLLNLVAQEELTVAELTTITELQQSRVSTHLGKLREAGVVRDRKVGASTYYSVNEETMPPAARALWKLLRSQIQDDVIDSDKKRDAAADPRARQGAVVARCGRRADGALLLAGTHVGGDGARAHWPAQASATCSTPAAATARSRSCWPRAPSR